MKAIFSVLFFGLVCASGLGQVPKLNSYPSARAVIFLDFDGQVVQGTSWNWSGSITAQPSGLSAAAITEIFNRVAEDYRIFAINITTDSIVYNAAPPTQRTRVILTPTWQWYGQAGGVAYVGSFSWGDDTPAWVFSGLLNSTKNIAEAASHEAGHTLGLQHQSNYDSNCVKTAEYSGGAGSGEISWAPIMGVGYYKNSTTWHMGPNAYGCDYIQNDITTIASTYNNVALRNDDHGNYHQASTTINIGGGQFEATGLINSAADKDVFRIGIPTSTHLNLSALPQSVGSSNSGANVDIRISLLNAGGDTLSRYNPGNLLNAGVDTNLNSGVYYLVIEGVGNTNLDDYGSVGFYTVNGSLAGALPVTQLRLSGLVRDGYHQLSWTYQADETIDRIEIQASAEGKNFTTVSALGANQTLQRLKGNDHSITYYRLLLINVAGNSYYSNTIALQGKSGQPISLLNSIVRTDINVQVVQAFEYQLFAEDGVLLKKGNLAAGINRIETIGAKNGLLILKLFNSSETQTFKLIKQ